VSGPVRVVVADDDPRVRTDFTTLLELEPDLVVVGTAPDGAAAVEAAARLLPDVVVMDVRMPRLDGIEATRRLRARVGDRSRVLVVTTFDLDDYVLGAVRAGAAGFLLKDRAPDLLAPAVRTVAAGDGIVSPRATARLLRELAAPAAAGPPGGLTEREADLVALLARGLTNGEIAARARISRATVKTHMSNVLAKLGLANRLQVVVWAYEHGLAAPPGSGGRPPDRWGP
jgi:DNA-binding NarL/FixJ family response regulator